MSQANTDIINGFQALKEEFGIEFGYTKDETLRTGVILDPQDSKTYTIMQRTKEFSTVVSFLKSDWPTLPKTGEFLILESVNHAIVDVRYSLTSPIVDILIRQRL